MSANIVTRMTGSDRNNTERQNQCGDDASDRCNHSGSDKVKLRVTQEVRVHVNTFTRQVRCSKDDSDRGVLSRVTE